MLDLDFFNSRHDSREQFPHQPHTHVDVANLTTPRNQDRPTVRMLVRNMCSNPALRQHIFPLQGIEDECCTHIPFTVGHQQINYSLWSKPNLQEE